MRKTHLPTDSKSYSERAFWEKEVWYRRRERMSLTRKLEALDRLLAMRKILPKLEGNRVRSS